MSDYRKGMSKTRVSFFGRIKQMLGASKVTEETWEEIETLLI